MQEVVDRFLDHLRGIWHYRAYAMIVVWLIAVAGWVSVWQLPAKYQSSAKVQVDSESLLRPLLTGLTIQTDVRRRLQMMSRVMLTRPNLEKLARMADLDVTARDAEQMETLLRDLKEKIEFGSTREQDFYTISFKDSDPQVAYRVVQSLMTIFVESTLGEKRVDSDVAQKFLDRQIEEYEERLLEAEERLQQFKKTNARYMTGGGQNYFQRLEEAKNRLKEATLQLEEEERRRDELKKQLDGERPSFGLGAGVETPGTNDSLLDARIDNLYARLDQLRLQYTDQHPDVAAVRDMIDVLEKQRREEKAAAEPPAPMSSDQNPVYQQMRIALAQSEAATASLKVRVREYERRVHELERMVNTIPEVEAQLQRLNRDYDINKKNYDALVARRETAKITEEAAESGDSIKFKIIEPPRVPLAPSGPDRYLLSSAVLAIALGLGVAVAFLLSQIRPVFFGRRLIKEVTGIPVLGSVSLVWTRSQLRRRRRQLAAFYGSLFMLVLSYGGLMAFHAMGPAAIDLL